ncbi:hypothetical protein PRECH8_14440 [Insulibacter thermoxylanivorax]|uniref:Uncharacterized protein n=1 Tax=Insulibacter thermoxylanivorax TaxID=2749268 RepID=A0A916QFK0_9BACL|nr:hypothetical protein PRECH8_14440 [Insulibacter thermoxylanivorax]
MIGEEQEAAKRVEATLSRIQAIQEAVNEIEQKKRCRRLYDGSVTNCSRAMGIVKNGRNQMNIK